MFLYRALGVLPSKQKTETIHIILEFIFLVRSDVVLLPVMNVSKLGILKMRSRKAGALQGILQECPVPVSCSRSAEIVLKQVGSGL